MTPETSGIVLSREEQEVSQNIGSWLGNQGQGQGQGPSTLPELPSNISHEEEQYREEERAQEEVVISPDTFEAEPTSSPNPPVDSPVHRAEVTPSQPSATPSRQFPPPGTLVVVQGVVHTTDVARPPVSENFTSRPSMAGPTTSPISRAMSTARSTTTSSIGMGPIIHNRASSSPRPSSSASADRSTSARNRLSALIPRSRPPSLLSVAPSVVDETSDGNTSDLSPESENANSPGGSTSATSVGSEPRLPESDVQNGTGNGNTNDGGAISSSSIDVLGTLLSVAAAATAASLLTGSSEPIFTSGLAPPGAAHAHPNVYANRPMSPTPTAGLGGLGFGLSDPDTDLPALGTEPAGRGRDRMRHAWGNLRERLGIPSNRTSNTTAPISPETGRPMDAREAMLSEMARAFNLGLGLGPNVAGGPSADSAGEGNGEEDAGRTLPPEDSFERFLIDLQADLRVALSQPEEQANSANGGTPAAEPSTIPSPPATADQSPAEGANVHIQVTPPDGIPSSENSDIENNNFDIDGGDEPEAVTYNDVAPVVPSTQAPPHTPPRLAPFLDPAVSASSSSSRTERRPGGGINWWRLYRFPPINAPPQSQGSSATVNNSRPASFPFTSTSPAGGVPPSDPISIPETTPAAAPSTNSTVIPVIVVGLQSVNMNRGQRTGDNDPFPGDEAETNGGGLGDDVDLNGLPDPLDNDATQGAQRDRRWRSRAADAIRNFRPGRRAGSRETQTGDAAGSRTFLIYVIGGYYPPDHHIVTGVNTLDSFEALWELAELLGQVKPPTATKEDIEKSGLEIIKPKQLAQFEKAGKISANCVERCLICLDDYEPEDDVRVLTCRHAFHKSCVDKWLQTGRNNCPACRSRGVSTDGPSSPMPAQM